MKKFLFGLIRVDYWFQEYRYDKTYDILIDRYINEGITIDQNDAIELGALRIRGFTCLPYNKITRDYEPIRPSRYNMYLLRKKYNAIKNKFPTGILGDKVEILKDILKEGDR